MNGAAAAGVAAAAFAPAPGGDLFAAAELELGPGASLLRGFALPWERGLADGVDAVAAAAPFRHMVTPGGYTMSVAMTNCGPRGWVSSARGYRYDPCDPDSGHAWPAMPAAFVELAAAAAARVGFAGFAPDACLVNRYAPGARLSLHQDRDELDFSQPIVSVSLGVPATFLWGGTKRKERPLRVPLAHGDVVVFGGASRLRFHGVAPLPASGHPFAESHRINLTFRSVR